MAKCKCVHGRAIRSVEMREVLEAKRVEHERKEIVEIEDKWAMNLSLLLLFRLLYWTPYIRYYGICYAALHVQNILSHISVVRLSAVSC